MYALCMIYALGDFPSCAITVWNALFNWNINIHAVNFRRCVLNREVQEVFKLAAAGQGQREGAHWQDRILEEDEPDFPEPDDSGIDSDDQRERRRLNNIVSDASSSSDEDPILKLPWVRAVMKKSDEKPRKSDDRHADQYLIPPTVQWRQPQVFKILDRASPPLYEVELTASDEDDDGSVLELVIPMQSRYQRVPTSSPTKPKVETYKPWSCGFVCCLRRK